MSSGVKVPDNRWVPDEPLVLDDPLICDDHQSRACRAVLGKVPDNHWVPDDPLALDDLLVTEDSFDKLMMLLVIEDSRVLEKNF